MHTTNPNAFVTETNAWATALTEAEADVLFDMVRRGALSALDASPDAGGDYHAPRDTARDAPPGRSNPSPAVGWFTQ